ncbi:hypothetical protein SAMN04488523_1352 [Sulfitobacter brevis]|uniref:Uncharacterized protein n=1 Tax=Sulfitobacter brevis TaxID=74348 RepID=A0A1I2H3B5_9RHOB|nr:hypothetical protein [Sulfitobacter brevis]SFF23467.1 hypothetical protein SAMN04488523_1352 [Sulfitobacter brevis]
MANLAKTTIFTSGTSPKETPLDKTTRIVRRINEDEAEIRHQKTARLRKARFDSDADTPDS